MAADVREEGDRITRLLEEVRGMAGPSTWARVEELVRAIVALHGAGLERVLALVAGGGSLDPALAGRLASDELVSSLLLLHGLHPAPPAERVAQAIGLLRERLGGAEVALVAIGDDGVARVRLVTGRDQACGFSAAALRRTVEQAILEAAPELAGVEVEAAGAGAVAERLVSLGRPPAAAGVEP
jgi:Fe-S cluster biogenesis protein NfuA